MPRNKLPITIKRKVFYLTLRHEKRIIALAKKMQCTESSAMRYLIDSYFGV